MQPSSAHSTFLAGVAAGVAAAAGTARLVAVLRQAYYKRQRAAAKATKAAKLAARANARAAAKAKAANAKAAAGTAAAEAEQAKAACAESKGKCKRETRPPTGSEFPEYTLVDAQDLRTFAEDCLKHAGCARENAEVVADVLLSADLRGVSSHGVQRLHLYCDEVRSGVVNGCGYPRLIQPEQSESSHLAVAAVDGCNAQGAVVGKFCMDIAVKKAKQFGVGIVVARNSNHYGIAGFYAEEVARNHGLIGMSMTNTSAIAAPTGSYVAALGTNPIAFSAPCLGRPPIVVDMATTTVPFGRVEVYARKGEMLPSNTWAVDAHGKPCLDAHEVIHEGGGMLPLGGASEQTGGHKGYCLMMMVELLCGVLAGPPARFGKQVGMSMNPRALGRKGGGGSISHFFMAVDPASSGFGLGQAGSGTSYRARASELAKQLTELPPLADSATGAVRVPGQRAEQETKHRIRKGIPIHRSVMASLSKLAKTSNVRMPGPPGPRTVGVARVPTIS
eukprot:INCI4845.3.p1 GENE.INCI4845.3~~INCI4845.3.p1  ORF type:complete len:504 (+),score=83.43 INCI4845.3:140-1651(+)